MMGYPEPFAAMAKGIASHLGSFFSADLRSVERGNASLPNKRISASENERHQLPGRRLLTYLNLMTQDAGIAPGSVWQIFIEREAVCGDSVAACDRECSISHGEVIDVVAQPERSQHKRASKEWKQSGGEHVRFLSISFLRRGTADGTEIYATAYGCVLAAKIVEANAGRNLSESLPVFPLTHVRYM